MAKRYTPQLRSNAQQLRKNMTREERRLWYDCLRQLPLRVHRQKVIGSYIVDFYIAKAALVIELDGSQHFDPTAREKDRIRDAYLGSLGITVLRYSNDQIHHRFSEVCQDIWEHIP